MNLGEIVLAGRFVPAALRVHQSQERARPSDTADLGSMAAGEALLTWTQVQPFIRRFEGERAIGEGQAWWYPTSGTVLLWDYALHRHRRDDPREDLLLRTLWVMFEAFLRAEFPDARRLVTPASHPVYTPQLYGGFLVGLGYTRTSARAFAKGISDRPR